MEDTYNNDIHRNQILSLDGHGIDYNFLFLSPFFILNRRGFRINKNNFENPKVKEIKLPIISYHFNMHVVIIPYFLLVSLLPFFLSIKEFKPDVIHCRNLISSFVAVFYKFIFRQNYKVVCDPRSVYVEECVIGRTFRYNGLDYKVWKHLERWIYKKSDACIGLSDFFAEYLSRYNNSALFIPAVVNDASIYSPERRLSLRLHYGLHPNDLVCCYIGSIGLWHSIDNLIADIKLLQANFKEKKIKIVFLSGNVSACNIIKSTFHSDSILMCGRVSPAEIIDYLLLSDIGMVPGSNKDGFCYDLLYDTMISSKAEEYLVAGLPIIVNSRIKSLAKLLEDNHAGYVSDGTPINFKQFDRENISLTFKKMFCVSEVVAKYNELYLKLISD